MDNRRMQLEAKKSYNDTVLTQRFHAEFTNSFFHPLMKYRRHMNPIYYSTGIRHRGLKSLFDAQIHFHSLGSAMQSP